MKRTRGRAQRLPSTAALRHGISHGTHLLRVHPVPRARAAVLAVAVHLLRQSANAVGKATPELSEDAARFLTGHPWTLQDLACRLANAVATNCGSLITAADLTE
jgi:hypothetical protein